MREPNTTILSRIHATWPAVRVTRDDAGTWVAAIPVGENGIVGVQRRDLALLEDKIGEVVNGAEREQRRAASTPGRTV